MAVCVHSVAWGFIFNLKFLLLFFVFWFVILMECNPEHWIPGLNDTFVYKVSINRYCLLGVDWIIHKGLRELTKMIAEKTFKTLKWICRNFMHKQNNGCYQKMCMCAQGWALSLLDAYADACRNAYSTAIGCFRRRSIAHLSGFLNDCRHLHYWSTIYIITITRHLSYTPVFGLIYMIISVNYDDLNALCCAVLCLISHLYTTRLYWIKKAAESCLFDGKIRLFDERRI